MRLGGVSWALTAETEGGSGRGGSRRVRTMGGESEDYDGEESLHGA